MANPGLSVYEKYTDQELFDLLQFGDDIAFTKIYKSRMFNCIRDFVF